MERKSLPLELKDLSRENRTALIAHAVYVNIDRTDDISTKGMFTSSWERKIPIDFLFNHETKSIVGKVLRTFEDEQKAYTEVKFGNWTLGDDVLQMLDDGVIRGASFGYETEKKDYKQIGNKKVRVLRQVKHLETSLLTEFPANPLAGVVVYKKSVENDSLVAELKSHIERMDSFCRNSSASDECIINIQAELKSAQDILSKYDTASTPLAEDGDASKNDSLRKALLLFDMQLRN